MKNDNSKNIIIVLLTVIIVILVTLIVLLATNKISFNNNTDNNIQENNQPSQENTSEKNKTTISNNSIDEETLSELLDIVGISVNDENVNNCLNMALSDNNYQENKLDIFSWYVSDHKLNTYRYNEDKCQASFECNIAYSCGGCMSITRKSASYILKLYNFDINEINFLKDLPEYADDYSYISSACCGSHCPYYITHDITTEKVTSYDINIVDNQIVSEIDETSDNYGNVVNSKEQTVTYQFKRGSDEHYYLYDVIVK